MTFIISGKTKVVGLIGWPVSHSLSPAMHNAAFEAAGLDFVYVCFPVRPEEVGEAVKGIRALGIAGMNVTIPHKAAVMPFVDEISEEAAKIGAVNTIVNRDGRLFATNTDVHGFLRSLGEKECRIMGARLVVIGAGGVARAIAVGSALNGTESIVLTDIIPEKARDLAEGVKSAAPNVKVEAVRPGSEQFIRALEEAGIIANATPLGMKEEDPLPLPPPQMERIPTSAVMFDAVYNLKGTGLQRACRERGITYIGGMDLLLYQGVRTFELWTGITPDVSLMKKVLQEKLS